MSLLPQDNLVANVRRADVALVITRAAAVTSETRGSKRIVKGAGLLMQTT